MLPAAITAITALWFQGRVALLGDVESIWKGGLKMSPVCLQTEVFGEGVGGEREYMLTIAGSVSPCTRLSNPQAWISQNRHAVGKWQDTQRTL